MTLVPTLVMAARSDVGLHRRHNEDALYCDPRRGLAILADGMGGYNAGEVASRMAVSQLAEQLGSFKLADDVPMTTRPVVIKNALSLAVSAANAAIYAEAGRTPQYAGMGTTLVVAWFYNNRLSVAHVGDSRLYRFRGGVQEQLTRDHSFLQEQVDKGYLSAEQARHSPQRNLVTRALGVDPTVIPEIHDYAVQLDDLFLLCSDGLSDMLEDGEIAACLQTQIENLQHSVDQLIDRANDAGGRDNISVILVKVAAESPLAAATQQGWPQ